MQMRNRALDLNPLCKHLPILKHKEIKLSLPQIKQRSTQFHHLNKLGRAKVLDANYNVFKDSGLLILGKKIFKRLDWFISNKRGV